MRENKFTNMAPGFDYSCTLPRQVSSFQTAMNGSLTNVKEGMFHRPDRRGVLASIEEDKLRTMELERQNGAPFLASSVYERTYMDPRRIAEFLLSKSDEDYEIAFNKTLDRKTELLRIRSSLSRGGASSPTSTPSSPSRFSRSGSALLSGTMIGADYSNCIDRNEKDVGLYLGFVLAGASALEPAEPPSLAVGLMVAAFIKEDRLSWQVVQRDLQKFRQALITQATPTRSQSTSPLATSSLSLSSSSSSRGSATELRLSQMRSCVAADFDTTQPTATITRVPQVAGVKDLYMGTPKSTLHIPGYCGHIPQVPRGGYKASHSLGLQDRPMQLDLLLTSKLSTSGYTGVMSRYVNSGQERVTGTDTRTTSGASVIGMLL